MSNRPGKFANKAKAILENENRPTGLSDFLEEPASSPSREQNHTENQTSVNPDIRKPANIGTRKAAKPENRIAVKPASVREEFKLPEELAETLRRYAFETRTTKTAVVIEVLNAFFKRKKARQPR